MGNVWAYAVAPTTERRNVIVEISENTLGQLAASPFAPPGAPEVF